MSAWWKAKQEHDAKQCKKCFGSGQRDDAECGDISYNAWQCPDCKGTGFKVDLPQESEIQVGNGITQVVGGLRAELPASTEGDFPDKTSPRHLLFMLQEIPKLTGGKQMRWLGFVQGVMASRGWIMVDEERDRTRPIFEVMETS